MSLALLRRQVYRGGQLEAGKDGAPGYLFHAWQAAQPRKPLKHPEKADFAQGDYLHHSHESATNLEIQKPRNDGGSSEPKGERDE